LHVFVTKNKGLQGKKLREGPKKQRSTRMKIKGTCKNEKARNSWEKYA